MRSKHLRGIDTPGGELFIFGKMTTLNDLSVGDYAEISAHRVGDVAVRARLLALGFAKGTRIKILGHSPAGDLLIIELHGSSLALRHEEAEHVYVCSVSSAVEDAGTATVPEVQIS